MNVIILGGGVAGMSAAHELAEREFHVTVLEKKKHYVGGKARSVSIKGSSTEGRKELPGEHGFRFFPGFYKHLIDTMRRIPFHARENGVADNLVECPNVLLSRQGFQPIKLPNHYPKTLSDIKTIMDTLFKTETGLAPGESKVIARKIWQLMTSCNERRDAEYEQMSWWDFTEADNYSDKYKELFVAGLTRSLVASNSKLANTRTNGNILLQMLFYTTYKDKINDRVLNGPTNEKWLFPWLDYLKNLGVHYRHGCEVKSLKVKNNTIAGVSIINKNGEEELLSADYYLCALPVERTAPLMNTQLQQADPHLAHLRTLALDVEWMNGIQFFLKEDVKIWDAHIIMTDTPWALTAISQPQFWKADLQKEYGDGKVKGILSVDISNWEEKGIVNDKPARDCDSAEEVIADVWEQMKRSINTTDKVLLKDEDLIFAFLDDAIIFKEQLLAARENMFRKEYTIHTLHARYGSHHVAANEEPLLVNKKATWNIRPNAVTKIPNFFLASDYVRTHTDLATMEAANEAAREAVNGILKASESDCTPCTIWKLQEPAYFNLHKWLDAKRFKNGKAWKHYPFWLLLLYWLLKKLKLIRL